MWAQWGSKRGYIPIALWNCYDAVQNDSPGTNNAVEGVTAVLLNFEELERVLEQFLPGQPPPSG